jgi:hypothetical protein
MNCDLENSFLLVYLSGPPIITHGGQMFWDQCLAESLVSSNFFLEQGNQNGTNWKTDQDTNQSMPSCFSVGA